MKNKENQATLKRVLQYAKPYRAYSVAAFILAMGYVLFTLLSPVLVGRAIDQVVDTGLVRFEIIIKILVGVGICVLLASLCQWGMNVFTQKLSIYTARDFRNAAFARLNNVPLNYIDTHPHGDIINRMVNDAELVSDGLQQGLTQMIPGVVTIVGTLVIMLVLNPLIALVVVLITPLSIFVASFIAGRSRKLFVKQSQASGALSAYINETVANQTVVKAFGQESYCQKEFEKITDALFASGLKSQFYSSISNPCTRFVNGIVYAAVCVIGAINAIYGNITVGQLSCFLTYANQYTKPFNEVTGVLTQLQTGLASAKRLFEVIDQPLEIAETTCPQMPVKEIGSVQAEHVFFSYVPQKPLIEDFNLQVKRGQKVAIVGPTGCGKTTLINLLMRFYDVNSGDIKIDHISIYDMQRRDLRSLYGMVLQETWLQNATVGENIAYGKPDAGKEEIVAAAKAAYAHSFIKRLPNGYDTVITAGGGNISAGQKQLLCIARIMLTHPDMLILDEATSSIDTRTEMLIQAAFEKLMQGRTSFVVAHRLSTIQNADIILVMNNGHIIEQGNHETLLAQKGFYANLYNSQFAVN
ncbi:MAG: ABC transporter ATP-binding protein [Oscillospiraceae bacterium]|nr:ABC transporter ATP-binding protein [Oscillospiraceae bacterium]